ncbi:MAG TPA: AAA family ATPase [Kofleriaceae bacterium]
MNQGAASLGGRFSLVRQLGEGGFGIVYEAVDTKFGGRVAVKLLRSEHAAAIPRFKREFRSLVDVQHANLVRLFELASQDGKLYFSMELVDGVDFLAYVTSSPGMITRTMTHDATVARTMTADATFARTKTADGTYSVGPVRPRERRPAVPDRLRAALVQVVEAVQALHDARKLHCDIKPTNVLVRSDGHVVLLDFGLIADLDETTATTLGTPGYMAPEQLAGNGLCEATDWYGVGAMLHEAITGEVPRPGKKCVTDVEELRPLAGLCDELLAPDPARRPSGAALLDRLGVTTSRAPRSATRLFGRDAERTVLRDAWRAVLRDGAPRIVRVIGASGIGKTALVEELLGELRSERAVVLTARCYEQESVPYKALDGAIDTLADLIARSGDSALIPPRAALLGRIFPVLRPLVGKVLDDDELLDSQAARRRAFTALRELFARLAASRPVVLFVDDVQWGDIDSARMLADLVQPPHGPRMLVVLGYRPTTSDGFLAALDELPLGIPEERIELAELSADDARGLAEYLLGAEHAAEQIGRESAGNPLFIHQLARYGGDHAATVELGDVILSRVEALEPNAKRLVETIALAGRPIEEGVAIEAAALDASAARAATLAVRQAKLVAATTTGGGVLLEPTHDRVRETVVSVIPGDVARTKHLRIADTLLARPEPDPDALVHHLRSGGDQPRTRVYALVAAERAEHALAFDRAAAHLQLVLDLSSEGSADRADLLERHGNALANAGRGGDAAESFERAADALATDPARELTLRRRSGELTLRSGRIELGEQRMERVLRAVNVKPPASRRSASLASVARRLRLFARGLEPKVRPLDPSAAPAKARLEALWSASTGLSMVNHVLADALGLQHMLEAIELGERSHLIRGLGYEAAFEAVIGGNFLRKRCAKILDVMDALATASSDPYDRAWAQMSKGVTSWFLGDWPAAWTNCDQAAMLYREHCRGVAWELAICDAYRLPALAYLGDLVELARVVPRAYAGARERGDLYAMNLLRLGMQSLPFLVGDAADEAIDAARVAVAPFPTGTYLLPHYHHLFAVAQAELYRGNADVAWRDIEAAWPGLTQSKLLMVQCLRCEIRHLHARAAIALAVSSEPPLRKRLHAVARKQAAKIAGDRVALAAPFAAAIRAALTDDAAVRQRELAAALAGFEAASMRLYSEALRDRLGAHVGGSEGAALQATAAGWFSTQQIKNPARMIAMLAPGV